MLRKVIRILENTLWHDSQLESVLPPGFTWQGLEPQSVTGVLSVEAGNVAKHPSKHRRAPHIKELAAQTSIVLRLRKLILWLQNKMKAKIMGLKESNLYDTIIFL